MDTKLAPPPSETISGPMTWEQVVAHPALQDLPFKIEQDAWGRIVMSPATTQHGIFQGRLTRRLTEALGGEAFPECPIETSEGTKVADVVWRSDAFAAEYGAASPLPKAPEICVEVRSTSNTDAEMEEKVMLYLSKGAQEVWICDLEGRVRFFGHEGERERSTLAPDFPAQL